jgi:sulfur-oxidizing protein SoxX
MAGTLAASEVQVPDAAQATTTQPGAAAKVAPLLRSSWNSSCIECTLDWLCFERRCLMRFTTKWGVILLMLLTAACTGPKSGAGLRLPDGDVQRGKAAFLELKCNTCHTVAGTEIPSPSKDYAYVRVVALGGEVRQVKTYGALVTSIINPSHSLAPGYPKELITKGNESAMANFNDTMTVRQLIDLVAFLQSRYEFVPPEPATY